MSTVENITAALPAAPRRIAVLRTNHVCLAVLAAIQISWFTLIGYLLYAVLA